MAVPLIRPFEPRDAAAFDALNRAWIETYFTLESKDIEQIEQPQAAILGRGGAIFIAEQGGEAVGCVAMLRGGEGVYELAKMAVDPSAQGGGIGRLLAEAAIGWACGQGASRLFLETNSKLAPALTLYEKVGFRHADHDYRSPYTRCNIVMNLDLSAAN